MNLPIPTCFRCKRPVDRVEWGFTPSNGKYRLEAHCHGEVDTCEIDATKFSPPWVITSAVAFQPKGEHVVDTPGRTDGRAEGQGATDVVAD